MKKSKTASSQVIIDKSTESIEARRKVIRAFVTGGGAGVVATQWARPVIDSTILPTHAATTSCIGCINSEFLTYSSYQFDPGEVPAAGIVETWNGSNCPGEPPDGDGPAAIASSAAEAAGIVGCAPEDMVEIPGGCGIWFCNEELPVPIEELPV
jgi:hypothetical protein